MSSRIWILSVVSISAVSALPLSAANAEAGDRGPLVARVAPAKPSESKILPGYSRSGLTVKFAEGGGVRLNGGQLTSKSVDVGALTSVLEAHPGATIRPLFHRSPANLEHDRQAAQNKSGLEQADLSLYYRMTVPGGANAEQLIDELNALPIVELAEAEPLPQPLPAVTSNYEPSQIFRMAAPIGVGARDVSAVPGALGDNVRVIDVEHGWRTTHEDLSKLRIPGALIPIGTPDDPFDDRGNHGMAVAGIIVGDDNGFGVTGIVPNAEFRMVNVDSFEYGYDLAAAIDTARANMGPGDVMLIEQQVSGPLGGCNPGCVPVEWYRAYYDVIAQATAAGIIVIEAAANGSQNLDDGIYGSPFPHGWANSGAIIVGGAGTSNCATPLGRFSYSNYGKRVNVQGPGGCVVSAGYGYLRGGTNRDRWYTDSFGGTSSASAVVAGVAAAISSAYEAANGVNLTSKDMRRLLIDTGTPQNTSSEALPGHIGPLPNLVAALSNLNGADVTPPVVGSPTGLIVAPQTLGPTLNVRLTWHAATDPSSISSYQLQVKEGADPYVDVLLPDPVATQAIVDLTPGAVYRFRVRATDGAGNVSAWNSTSSAMLRVAEETDLKVSYAGTWTHGTLKSSSGGYVNSSSTAGASALFSFSGTNAVLVSTTGPSRGIADIYVDGSKVSTVDFYASTMHKKVIAWELGTRLSPGSHTLQIRATGQRNSASTSSRVDVDAFVSWP